MDEPVGVLLLQLGTPDSTSVGDVRRYLREFLGDPRVLDLSAIGRWLLLNLVILPFRPRRSAEAYEKIWTEDGSPLLIHSLALVDAVQDTLGHGYRVEVGMRYQSPSIESAVDRLMEAGCNRVVVMPLFPQYASASGGSALARTLEILTKRWNLPDVASVVPFYDHPGFVNAVANVTRPLLEEFRPDLVLFSYHGLPEQQIRKSDPSGAHCLRSVDCCASVEAVNRFCYRAHALATTRAVVSELGLQTYATTFQSRLKSQKWIEPYTDVEIVALFEQGVRRLAVLTPSFVADCLETLEEIGIRLRKQWMELGGEDFLLVPCVNTDPVWVDAVATMIRESA